MAKESKLDKVDLGLLKKLVGELESSLQTADSLKNAATDSNKNDYVVEMAKASGLAVGVMTEASMLVMDIQSVMQSVQGMAAGKSSTSDILEKILGPLKGGGGTSN